MATLFARLREALEARRLIAQATVISGVGQGSRMLIWPSGETHGSLHSPELEAAVQVETRELLVRQQTARFTLEVDDETSEVFVEVYPPPPRLLVVGAVHIAIHLVTFANALAFETIVIDGRAAFATPERFPHADRLIHKWPADALAELALDESSYIVVLTHDAKLDDPALAVAIESPARYVGALGSRKTHAKRVAALKEMGAGEGEIARIQAPIGLDLGGRRPEEIAVSIIAQVVAVRNDAG